MMPTLCVAELCTFGARKSCSTKQAQHSIIPSIFYPKGDPALACPSVERVTGAVLQFYRNFPQWRL